MARVDFPPHGFHPAQAQGEPGCLVDSADHSPGTFELGSNQSHVANFAPMSEQEADRLQAEGWTIIPFDTPSKAMRGFVAIKDLAERTVTWPMFEGGEYRTNDAIVSPTDLVKFIEGGGAVQCDDPVRRLLGFARYDHGTKTAFVRQIRLTALRRASEADKTTIMAARGLMGVNRP